MEYWFWIIVAVLAGWLVLAEIVENTQHRHQTEMVDRQ